MGINGFTDAGRVDINMNNSGIGAEFFGVVGHPIVKAGTYRQNKIGMVHGLVRFIAAMHTQHTNKLLIAGRVTAQSHQRSAHLMHHP